jgi:hypothetical protein
MNPISIPEPSLSSRAMLCSLSISMWSARKHAHSRRLGRRGVLIGRSQSPATTIEPTPVYGKSVGAAGSFTSES